MIYNLKQKCDIILLVIELAKVTIIPRQTHLFLINSQMLIPSQYDFALFSSETCQRTMNPTSDFLTVVLITNPKCTETANVSIISVNSKYIFISQILFGTRTTSPERKGEENVENQTPKRGIIINTILGYVIMEWIYEVAGY